MRIGSIPIQNQSSSAATVNTGNHAPVVAGGGSAVK